MFKLHHSPHDTFPFWSLVFSRVVHYMLARGAPHWLPRLCAARMSILSYQDTLVLVCVVEVQLLLD